MKVYIAHHDNGESFEDSTQWYSDNVYINKEDCIKELRSLGFVERKEKGMSRWKYIRNGGIYTDDFAAIEELNLVK